MRRHWWWRPGWRPGRRLYAWHLTFGDQTVARGLRSCGGWSATTRPAWPGCRAWTSCPPSGCT
jgi:hypothetical protein